MRKPLPHPPWCPHGDVPFEAPSTDYMTKDGAHALADRIKAAWKRAGHDVETVVVAVPRAGKAEGHWAVRMPGLVNGLPTKQVPA